MQTVKLNNNVNVVAYYNVCGDQLAITAFLRKQCKLSKNAAVYFDDADLVYGDKTVVRNALCNSALTMQHLVAALQQHLLLVA